MKKILSAILSVSLMLSICSLGIFNIPTKAADTVTSGTTGDCTWTLDGDTLTISGKGYMRKDYVISHYKNNITKVIIQNGITSICNEAFANFSKVTSIAIPNSVTSIYSDAFSGCTSLTSITIPDSVTGIYSDAFFNTAYYNNSSNWENAVLYIGKHLIDTKKDSLSGNYAIKSGTKSIAYDAFNGCTKLTSVTIPGSITLVNHGIFANCSSLTSVTIHEGVTHVGDNVFEDCSSLSSITIPSSIKYFSRYNFTESENLTEITLSANIDMSLLNFENLKKLNLSKNIIKIDGDYTKTSGLVINYSGARKYWETVELDASLERAILDGRAKVICTDDNTVSSSAPTQTTPTSSSKPAQTTTSSKPTQNNTTSSKPSANINIVSSKPAITVSSKPSQSNTTSSKPSDDSKTSSVLTQSVASEVESNILTETESEPTGDTASENISSQIGQNNGNVSPIAIVVIVIGAVVLGAGAAVGVVLYLKKKNKF